jgi:hypothetical protein
MHTAGIPPMGQVEMMNMTLKTLAPAYMSMEMYTKPGLVIDCIRSGLPAVL